MRKMILALFMLLGSFAAAQEPYRGVFVEQPEFTTTNPVHIRFRGSSNQGYTTKMIVYDNGTKLLERLNTDTLDTYITLSTGRHTIAVQFWDGRTWTKAQYTINIAGTTSGSSLPASISLRWDVSPTVGVLGYNIYRSTGTQYARLNTTPLGGVTYTDTGVRAGNTYYYVVTAVDGSGRESIYSNQAMARP